MKIRTNENSIKTVVAATFLSMVIYFVVGFLGIYQFGSLVQSSVLTNIDAELTSWESLTL
jgi:amino acid permease